MFTGLSTSLWAQLSPGELHKSHAFLEGVTNCTKCHSSGKKITSQKCLACHTILKERIEAGKGLHANPEYKNCVDCHSEHHGRNFKLIYWEKGQENFDHTLTGYPLEGGHTKLKCNQCHKPEFQVIKSVLLEKKKDLNKTLLGLDKACLNCHIDEHRSQLSQDCLSCHVMEAWKPQEKFDHDKTDFPLTGKHIDVSCIKCHPQLRDNKYPNDKTYLKYAGLKFAQCSSCHEDAHKGQLGKNCKSCHQTKGWKVIETASFDHSRTRFPLKGKHNDVKCESCHKPGLPRRGLKFAHCSDCHEDFHKGQFRDRASRGDCKECHTERGFKPSTFTLAKHQKSSYPLKGAHLAVPCIACHGVEKGNKRRRGRGSKIQMNRFVFENTRCNGCHEDIHRGEVKKYIQEGGCEFCHVVDTWHKVIFDHSKTDFPLKGKHRDVQCTSCHTTITTSRSVSYIQFQNMATDCQNCHKDIHRGQFRTTVNVKGKQKQLTDCSRCHSEENWKPEKFDHNRDSKFSLEGAHEKVPCQDCHKKEAAGGESFTRFKPLSSECKSCHGA